MKNIQKRKQYILLLIEVMLIFIVHICNINNLYAFFLSEDELAYWGNAAFFIGRDWESAMSYCNYYSYGYSFILMLIMSLPISSLMMYRFAIIANALFMVASFLVSYYLFIRLLPQKNKSFVSIACMAVALYASYVVQSNVTWPECYLVLFVWLILLQGYLVCKKTTIGRVIVFGVELVYIYMIHQRTVPFLVAGVFLIILLAVRKKVPIKYLILVMIAATSTVCISLVLKYTLKIINYSSMGEGNDYVSIIRDMSVSNLFVPAIQEMMGQFFYLWSASFGLIPLGIGFTIGLCIKKWRENDVISYFYVFTVLSFGGILMVSSIFVRNSVQRVDYLIYGRYIEIMIGFFLVVGFLFLCDFIKWRKSTLVFFVSCILFVALACLVAYKITSWNIALDTYYQGVCAAAVYWFYVIKGLQIKELCYTVLFVEIIVFSIIHIRVVKRYIFVVIIFIFAIFWVKTGNMVIKRQINPYQTENNQALAEKEDVLNYIKGNYRNVALLSNTQYNIRGSIQLYLQDMPLQCVNDLKELNSLPDILIVDNDDNILEKNIIKNYHFVCMIGKKGVYSLDEIRINDSQGEISKNQFGYNEIGGDESGYVMYGPYIQLEPGSYEVTFQMASDINKDVDLGRVEVASDCGTKIICSTTWDGVSEEIKLYFQLEERTNEIEFRYYKFEGNDTMPDRVILNGVNG